MSCSTGFSRRTLLRMVVATVAPLPLAACVVGPSQASLTPVPTPLPLPTSSPAVTPAPALTPGVSPVPSGTTTPQPKAALRFFAGGSSDERTTLSQLVQRFAAQRGAAPVTVTPLASGYVAAVNAAFAAGTPPDLLTADWRQLPSWESRLSDLTSALTAIKADIAGLFAGPKALFTVGTGLVGLPYGFSPRVLYVNTAALTVAGQKAPTVSTTWPQFTALAQALTIGSRAGFGAGIGTFDWLAWVGAAGGDLFDQPLDPTSCTLDSPQAVEGLQQFADLWLKQGAARSPLGNPPADPAQLFIDGSVAMVAGPRSWVPRFVAQTHLKWNVTFLPAGPGGHGSPIAVSGVCAALASKQVAAAAEVIAFLCTQRASQDAFATGDLVPAYRAAADAVTPPKGAPTVNTLPFVQALDFAMGPYRTPSWAAAAAIWSPGLDAVWNGSATAATAAKPIAQAIAALLQRAAATPTAAPVPVVTPPGNGTAAPTGTGTIAVPASIGTIGAAATGTVQTPAGTAGAAATPTSGP